MKFEPVPLADAKGKSSVTILPGGVSGQRLLRKGKPLTAEDLDKLRALGRTFMIPCRCRTWHVWKIWRID